MSVVPTAVSSQFQRAGWFVGRRVAVDDAVPHHHAGYAVLAELGGITLREPSPNVVSIAFRHVSGAAPEVAKWEAVLATTMVGVAEQDGGHGELYVTERGQVVGFSLVHHACWFVAGTIQEAMLAIFDGRRSKPMMLPDQQEVTLYGARFRKGDKAVLGPADLA